MEANVKAYPQINLLLVTARPDEEEDVGYRTISRPMVELLETPKLPVRIHILRPGTFQALSNHLDEVGEQFYHIIHFDTHGSLASYEALEAARKADKILFQSRWGLNDIEPYEGLKAYLFFEGNVKGKAVPVEAAELAHLLLTKQIPVCIINACQSAKQISQPGETSLGSKLMEAGIQAVLAVSYSITVSAAITLMEGIYQHLFDHHTLPEAINRGRRQLHKQKERKAYFNQTIDLEDWLLPVFYQNRPVDFNLRDFTPQEEEAYYQKRELRHKITHQPVYGFFGRDLDIMAIEKRLLSNNMLLLRGMGGTGKSTLLDYLGWWWEKTGFVEQSFYFGYDETAFTLEQILFLLAKRLYDKQTFAAFQSSSLTTQKGKITDALKSERFCLILDNCESITGSPLAVPNTLPEDEQEKLKDFLQDLSGGKSFVLFGSRGEEAWLEKGTFKSNIHHLQGLDPEARSDLAVQILKEVDVPFPQDDPEFHHLMKLLAGYPLAMEVVLPNLKQYTPAQIIASLKAGDVNLERQDGKDKTESILKCVDYSHGNLSPDAQKLLLCFAPFNSVINLGFLPEYTEQLRKFPTFEDWPFQLWEEVIQETVNWGLMEPLGQGIPIMNLQPVFPFFLRVKLQQTLDETGREHLNQAFMAHYNGVAGFIYTLFDSKEPEEKQVAMVLTELEYENIYAALEMCLQREQSIFNTYRCLSTYIDGTQDQKRGLRLGKMVLKKIEGYPSQLLKGELGVELAVVIDTIATRFLLTRQYEQAKNSYLRALEIFQNLTGLEERQKALVIAGIYHNLGVVAQELREFEEARKNYEKALEIKIEFKDRYSQAGTYHHLGMVAQELREFEEARKNYEKALEIKIEFKDRYSQAGTYHHLGMVAQELREFEEARKNYEKALEIYIEFKDRYSQAGTYHNMGMVAQELREFEEARKNYEKALEICIEFKDQYSQASTYHQLGVVAQELREFEEARKNYEKALEIYIEFKDRYYQEIVRESLKRLKERKD
jgi:tetratricopeptide (TPR) repeat protein